MLVELIKKMKPAICCDRNGDCDMLTRKEGEFVIFDPALHKLDTPEFGLESRSGVGALGQTLGIKMDMKRDKWKSEVTGISGVRWRHWGETVLLKEVRP